MNNENFKVGSTRFGGSGGGAKQVWHKLEPGDNYYRVLPPLFSLAEKGQYSKFYAFHGGFRTSNGRVNMFRCLEVKDNKTKLVKVHCPVCDMVTENMAKYKLLKDAVAAGKATEEQAKKFWMEKVFPYKVQKSFFMNAMNQGNQVGVLGIPYKAWQALDHVIQSTYKTLGIDITGMEGAWVKIKKIQPYAGSKDTSYGAELVYEQNGASFTIKRHVLSPESVQSLQATAFDIGNLYRTISHEDAASLVAAPVEMRSELADRVFMREKVTKEGASNPLETQIPGTTARAVGRIENTPDGGFSVQSPDLPSGWNAAQNSSAAPANPDMSAVSRKQVKTEQNNTGSSPSADASGTGSLTDEEFAAIFGQ
jgi:hypothetical protein